MRQLLYFLFILFSTANVYAKPLPALIPYRDGNKWGYCDSNGNVKITPQWDGADFFCGDKAVVTMLPDAPGRNYAYYCLIDREGNYIIPPCRHWNRGWAGWQKTLLNAHDSNGRYGLLDTNNNLLVPFEYEQETRYPTVLSEGYKIVFKNGKAGLINKSNETLIPFLYEHIDECHVSEGSPVFKVTLNGRFGLVDLHGREILPALYSGIYPSGDWGWKSHQPKGFVLVRTVLKNPKDSTKGYKDLYGWTDYPGGELIEPKYNYFLYLSDSFYVADGKLYTHNHKLALPGTYNSFSRRNDTLFANGATRKKGRDSNAHEEYTFDPGNLRLLSKKTVVEKNFDYRDMFPQPQWTCGTGMQTMHDFEEMERRRPTLLIEGKTVKDFVRDSIHWYSDYWIGDDRIVLHGQTTRYVAYQAVVNKEGAFLFTPFRSQQGVIAALNLTDSLIIVRAYDATDGSHFGLCNLEGQMIIPFQKKILSMPFRGPSGKIFMAVSTPPQPPTFYVGQRLNFGTGAIFPGSTSQLCDTSLNPLPALKNFYFHELADKRLSFSEGYHGYLKGTDTNNHWGYMNIEGDTLFKKLSFQYKNLYSLSPYLFIVDNDKKNAQGPRLVNRKNEAVLDTIPVTYVNHLSHERTNHGELFYPDDVHDYRLIQVTYRPEGTNRDEYFYMDEKGLIYAGRLR